MSPSTLFPTAEILQANDSLTHVINLYKQQVKGEIVNGNRPKQSGGRPPHALAGETGVGDDQALNLSHTEGGTALLDLSGLDTSPQSPPSFPEFPTPTDGLTAPSQEVGISLLDDELMSLGNERVCACWRGAFRGRAGGGAFSWFCLLTSQG